MDKIRTGIIRCDLHAIYYANPIQKHDPYLLREPELGRGGYFYFYTYYNQPRKIAFPEVPGFEVTKVWDEDRRLAENMSRIYYGKPKVCDSFEEVSDDVDLVLIADCNEDGSDHLKLATPGLKKGVPTFVDKPFTYEVEDARTIVELAKEHDTPVMSLSILRMLPQATLFRNRFREIGQPEFGTIKGGGDTMAGHIHAISLAQHLFGAGVESVECMGQTSLAYVHLAYGEKPDRPEHGVVLNCASGVGPHCAVYASAYSSMGAVHSPALSDFEFPYGVVENLKMIKKMVQTRKPQTPYQEMVECIAIATAARRAQKERRRVYLKEI
jgi:predicted dehydrogenase